MYANIPRAYSESQYAPDDGIVFVIEKNDIMCYSIQKDEPFPKGSIMFTDDEAVADELIQMLIAVDVNFLLPRQGN